MQEPDEGYGSDEEKKEETSLPLSLANSPNLEPSSPSSSGFSFFLVDPPEANQKEPTSSSSQTARVSRAQWQKVEQLIDAALEEFIDDGNKARARQYAQQVFDDYYNLYCELSGKNKTTLKKIQADPTKFLHSLSLFTASFESIYDSVKTFYKNQPSYAVENLSSLRLDILPSVLRTFHTVMQAYQQYVAQESLQMVGPIRYGEQPFAFQHENTSKYLFYTKHDAGYIPFTVYPHRAVSTNLYETYIPYFQTDQNYFADIFLFSLDVSKHPVLEKQPGLLLHRDEVGYALAAYRGDTTVLPYTKSLVTYVVAPRQETIKETIDTLAEILVDSANNLASETIPQKTPEQHKQQEEKIQRVAIQLPEPLKGQPIHTARKLPVQTIETLKGALSTVLGDADKIFIPFLRTALEEAEQTYLYLLALQETAIEQSTAVQESFLLHYIQQEILPGATLEQAIEAYETELITAYEEEIRRQQEERSHMVADGAHYASHASSQTQKQPSSHAGKRKPSKGRRADIKHASSSSSSSSSTMNSTSLPDTDTTLQKAHKKLSELKTAHKKNNPLKFRKFMQLVNTAAQGLLATGTQLTAELNKSSHGKIETDRGPSASLVRSHGGTKEKAVSSIGQKKLLTGLVDSLMQKLTQKANRIV